MKGKLFVLLAMVLLLASMAAVTASAEENGYWTETVDEAGNVVMIYTYTEPVEYRVITDEGVYCDLNEYTTPVAAVGTAQARMAAEPQSAEAQTVSAAPGSAAASLAVFGVLLLAGLGLALYKAV